MSKIIVTIEALGASIGSFLAKAEADKSALLPHLAKFKEDFDVFKAQAEADAKEFVSVTADLKAQLESALQNKADTSTKPVVTINKVRYQVNHGAFPYSAEELAADPEKAAVVLKIVGQNALIKL